MTAAEAIVVAVRTEPPVRTHSAVGGMSRVEMARRRAGASLKEVTRTVATANFSPVTLRTVHMVVRSWTLANTVGTHSDPTAVPGTSSSRHSVATTHSWTILVLHKGNPLRTPHHKCIRLTAEPDGILDVETIHQHAKPGPQASDRVSDMHLLHVVSVVKLLLVVVTSVQTARLVDDDKVYVVHKTRHGTLQR